MSALAGGSQKLTRLVCTSCALRSEHIEALPRALTSQSQIQILDLSENQIDCDGATALARALLEGSKLRQLSLRRNKIADRGAGAFADVLRRAAVESQPLSALDLDGNEIEAPGWTLLDQALEEVELQAEAWFDKFRLGRHQKPDIWKTSVLCQRIFSCAHLTCFFFHYCHVMWCLIDPIFTTNISASEKFNKILAVGNDLVCMFMFLPLALVVLGPGGLRSREKLSVWRTYNLVISLFGVASRCLKTMSWCVGLSYLNQDIWIGALLLLEMLLLRRGFKSPPFVA